MNVRSLLLLFSFFLPLATQAQDAPQVQNSLVAKVTATWCTNCGNWGWTLFNGVLADNADQALVIANHYSGNLTNPTSEAIAENFNVFSQPRFILNNEDQGVSSGTIAAKRVEIKDQIDANAAESPLANAGILATLDGDVLNVKTKTQFFQATSGEYYLGVYIIENGIVASQAGQGAGAVHKNVLRTSMSESAFGELIMDGSISMGMEIEQDFSMTLDAGWNAENLSVATIIWKKNGEDYEFVNTHFTDTFETPTAVVEISADQLTATLFPTVTSSTATLLIDVQKPQNQAEVRLLGQNGQLLNTLFRGVLQPGTMSLEINQTLASGTYLVLLNTENGILSKKLIIQ